MPRVYTRRALIDRVFDHVVEVDGHWIWTGKRSDPTKSPDGYGQITEGGHDGRGLQVHRVVWEFFRGPIPDGLELDHLDHCLRTLCCNPEHLDPVTHAENQRRRALRTYRCRNGHAYTPANTRVTRGYRECRRCHADRAREGRRRRRAARQAATVEYCGRGHLRTTENTWWREHGPTCRDCMAESATTRAHREGPEVRRARALKGSG